jgi:hypothetical protein
VPRVWAAVLGAACSLATPSTAPGQTTATLDLGMSSVRYDGFLRSGAASIAPSVRWDRPGGYVTGQGAYLRFESGNQSFQGTLTGSVFTAPAHRWRGQILASVGASSYATFASFHQTIGEARVHLVGERGGLWIGGTAGRASFGGANRPITGLAVAAWAQRSGVQLFASATRAFVGDTAYSDIEAAARSQRGTLILEGYAGARVWSRGGGRGVYGEGSATLTLSGRLALVLSGGRYPTDPIRGSISGRYVSAAIRLYSVAPRRPVMRDLPWDRSPAGSDGSVGSAALVEVLAQGDRAVRFVVRVPDAILVEIAGDFSDWRPIPLGQGPDGVWEGVVRMSRGVHRVAVRIDGGPWRAPAGARRADDDFDGEVGILVVP